MFANLPTTRWTQIRAAQSDSSHPSQVKALWEQVFRTYWPALFWLARRKGLSQDAAADAVQSFAEEAIAHTLLDAAREERGRLRSFLAKCFTRHILGLHERESAQKRGAHAIHVDVFALEEQLGSLSLDAETAFEQGWAMSLLEDAKRALREEHEREKRAGSFALLEAYLEGQALPPLAELAQREHVSVPFLKSFFFRGKKRYRELLVSAVRETLDPNEDAEQELTKLMSSLTP